MWWACRLPARVVQANHHREACRDATCVVGNLVLVILRVNDSEVGLFGQVPVGGMTGKQQQGRAALHGAGEYAASRFVFGEWIQQGGFTLPSQVCFCA